MSTLPILLGEAFATSVIHEWLSWQAKQQRPAGYVWTDADINAFLGRIDADTPEAIRVEVKSEG